MELTTGQIVEALDAADDSATVEAVPTADHEALDRQRIRFDGFFTGPTW
jgi:hypothetical protein